MDDVQLVRLALASELETVNFIEALASHARELDLKEKFQAMAKEEEEHVGELAMLLLEKDPHLSEGEDEASEEEPD